MLFIFTQLQQSLICDVTTEAANSSLVTVFHKVVFSTNGHHMHIDADRPA